MADTPDRITGDIDAAIDMGLDHRGLRAAWEAQADANDTPGREPLTECGRCDDVAWTWSCSIAGQCQRPAPIEADTPDAADPLDEAMAIMRDQRHGASIDAWPVPAPLEADTPDAAGIDPAAIIRGENTPPGLGVALEFRMGLKCSRADCGKIIVSDETDRLLAELAEQPPDAEGWPEGWPVCCGYEMGVPIPHRRYVVVAVEDTPDTD